VVSANPHLEERDMSGRNVIKIYQTKKVISSCYLDMYVELTLVLDQGLLRVERILYILKGQANITLFIIVFYQQVSLGFSKESRNERKMLVCKRFFEVFRRLISSYSADKINRLSSFIVSTSVCEVALNQSH
jgi:hypothetical protein